MSTEELPWLRSIKERLEKATPGPWESRCANTLNNKALPNMVWSELGWVATCHLPKQYSIPDAEFIANTPTDIKNLIEEREVLRKALKYAFEFAHNYCASDGGCEPHCIEMQTALAFDPTKGSGK